MREIYSNAKFGTVRGALKLPDLGSTSFHMRFLGNPGTGKTVVARIVGELLMELQALPDMKKDRFVEVSRSHLVAQYTGQTAQKVIDTVKESLGGVLFIDEAYSLVQEGEDAFGHEAVDTLIKEMEDKREKVIVILAGYEQEMETFFDSNPGFKSRVPFTFYFEDYTCPSLARIGALQLEKKEFKLPQTAPELASYEAAVGFFTG